jgi:2-iminobutanoate/2-iminopropanoate deaminase
MNDFTTAFDLPEELAAGFPYSQAIREGNLLFVAGQLASDDSDWAGPDGDIEAETKAAMDRIGRVLALAGATHGDILRVGIYLTDLSVFERMNAVYRRYFSRRLPARTTVGVASLLRGAMIEIDCVARLPPGGAGDSSQA